MDRYTAWHWVATTHGTWLHGDERGSWYHGKLIDACRGLKDESLLRMKSEKERLATVEQMLVAVTFGEVMQEKGWRVYAASIRSMHVHVVFDCGSESLQKFSAILKSRSARKVFAVRRQMGHVTGRSLWTKSPFAVQITTEEQLRESIGYVRGNNLEVGREQDPYPWITPIETD